MILHKDINPNSIYNIPKEYISFLCCILLNNSNSIKKYLDIMLEQNKNFDSYTEEQITIFNIINDYFKLNKKIKDTKILIEKLSKKYKSKEIKSTIKIINNLTFEEVVSISLKKSPSKKMNLKSISLKLLKIQEKNLPNQIKLKELFENL